MDNCLSKKTYKGLDLFKLIAALFIVLLHTIETSNFYAREVQFVFTRFAVPFFFMTSGFFFYNGLKNSKNGKDYFVKYEKRLLIIFLIWGVLFYSPYVISDYLKSYPNASAVELLLLLFRKIFIVGAGPYWYLVALITTAAFMFFMYKLNSDLILNIIIAFCTICMIGYSCFKGALSSVPIIEYLFKFTDFAYSWEFNFYLYGIPFFGIGYIIAKKNINLNMSFSIVILFISTLLRVVEYNLYNITGMEFFSNNSISIMYIFQALAFFMLGININPGFSNEHSKSLRQCSSFIYYVHVIILYNYLDVALVRIFGKVIFSYKWIFPKFIIVSLICVLFYVLIKKINNKYLNILING